MADDIRTCADLDERLAPYVDGEDAPVWRRAVESHLAKCPPCRAGVDAEAVARDLVRDHRRDLLAHAPESLRARCAAAGSQLPAPGSQLPASGSPLSASGSPLPAAGSQLPASGSPLPAAGSQLSASGSPLPAAATVVRPPASVFRRSLRRWVPLSLAATLVLAVAGVFVFGLNDRVEALAASLAMDHSSCFRFFGNATGAEPGASERAWQQDQGWPIVVPEAAPAQELRLVNVRRCLTIGGRSAHMMYTWHGQPVSVYILQGDAGRDRVVHKMGAQAVVWCANQRTYAVVWKDGDRDLTPIVNYMKAKVR